MGDVKKCYGYFTKGCEGTLETSLAGYIREPESQAGRAKRRSVLALESARKKMRRMADNAASNVRATAAVSPVWECKKCQNKNLMARYECYKCSYRGPGAEWWELALTQS